MFPLTPGAIALDASEICRDVDGPLPADALADTATALLLGRSAVPAARVGGDLWATEPERRWGVVHRATGMVSVQLDIDLGAAFLRSRAPASVTGLILSEVAADVVARRLRFTPDPDPEEQR